MPGDNETRGGPPREPAPEAVTETRKLTAKTDCERREEEHQKALCTNSIRIRRNTCDHARRLNSAIAMSGDFLHFIPFDFRKSPFSAGNNILPVVTVRVGKDDRIRIVLVHVFTG